MTKFLCLILFVFNSWCYSQNENGLVNWLSLKEAQEKNKTLQKPFLIDIYTDWCGWCKHMMKTTYSNPNIAGYINQNFYAVKFNAETKDTIEFNGKIYKPFSKEPKTPHELAVKFLGNNLSYPSTIFTTNNFEYNLLSQGFLEDKKIEPLLVFMVENAWRTSIYEEFSTNFNKTFYDTAFKKVAIATYDIKELEKLQKKKQKKVLVNFTSSFCNTCKIIQKTTFVDTLLGNYLNKNYYVVNFNAESNDTIIFNKQKYFKQLVNNYPLNTLALTLSNNRLSFPSISILDESNKVLEVLNFYQSPQQIKPVLEYFGSNSYKTTKWPDFIKDYSIKKSSKK